MNWLSLCGFIEMAVAVITGWGMVYIVRTPREKRRQDGLRDPRRWRQGHIEMLMQGTVLIAAGAAMAAPPLVPALIVAIFGWVAPLSFFPVAFRPDWGDWKAYRLLDNSVFVGLTVGWVSFAAVAIVRF